jgi:hypothetical protein
VGGDGGRGGGIFAGVLLSQPRRPPTPTLAPSQSASCDEPDFGTTVRLQLQVSPGVIGSNTFERRSSTTTPVAVGCGPRLVLRSRPTDIGGSSLSLKHRVPTGRGRAPPVGDGHVVDRRRRAGTEGRCKHPLKVTPKLPEQISTIAGTRPLHDHVGSGLTGRPMSTRTRRASPTHSRSSVLRAGAADATASATDGSSGHDLGMKLIRFDRSHFAANTRLTPGT